MKREHNKAFGQGKKSSFSKPAGSFRSEKPYGGRSEKPYGAGNEKPYGNRSEKPYGGRSEKPYGASNEKPYGNRSEKPYGGRSEKPYGAGSEKPYGSRGEKPFNARGEKPFGTRGDKPYGSRSEGPAERSWGERDERRGPRFKPTGAPEERRQSSGRTDFGRGEKRPYKGTEERREGAPSRRIMPRDEFAREESRETFAPRRTTRPVIDGSGVPVRPAVETNEEEQREDLLEGRHPVLAALKAGRPVNRLFVAKGVQEGSMREILAVARDKGIPITEVDRRALDAQAPSRGHQGVMAQVAPVPYVEVETILERAQSRGEAPFVLILDGMEDPHNVGALLRTAECAGVHGVILPKRRGVALTSTVAKAAAGAIEHIPIARVTNLVQTVAYLKEQGLWVIGSDSEAPAPYHAQDFTGPVAIVVGGEGKGVSRLLQEKCDFLVAIPMAGQVSSLNASVAGALLMYERARQQNQKATSPASTT
ncbi:23S rRNA (guanosine(2251)-2'-O)-methyltransferase RlmB [Heliophilum fasciatum]|uniref:Putative rRNA methylase n=1 Tax=Heliophilum fasciatum TaxID=35700 RepID=A0A4R2RNB8_9FIRM|nr:23S rRNA (guanosine(2251)-2'-O)-methyltransferase RlmB [Heliophilum fasciatum]MCW2277834.1 putative rRNA methylase [Heliophilum fasciatum]TCP64673.1 putative rRNA methylase [Heliophilum fasciatum]